ncbi:hypothetical protein ACJIZ3_020817 [Penstemon smallii]|uniref:Ribosomal protein L34Ae n=1 Tax=Penstemon smallii TaxID=265156 RepID=A0ABD3SKJ0_9LAMI
MLIQFCFCSSKETILRLFYNASSSFFLLFIFFHFTSIFLAKLFIFLGGNPFYQRHEDGYEFDAFSDEEVEEENEYYQAKSNDFLDNIIHEVDQTQIENEEICSEDQSLDNNNSELEVTSNYSTPAIGSSEEEILARDTDTDSDSDDFEVIDNDPTSKFGSNLGANNYTHHQVLTEKKSENEKKLEINFKEEENFLVFQPDHKSEGKKIVEEKEENEIFGDTFTIGSTSKDSSEWRSSINCRDSGTEDPFSSSSRRSCPKWESYAVFQKYDEEMLFLDRISAQKLHETESLRSIQACPRSISERIVHKLGTKTKRSSEYHHNPYQELECAYVAQICLTWEALNWNYKYFQRLRASRREFDPGCPAYVAQQFQQFQVLLQRYIENEPYEYGRRPEIYAKIRSLAPKLLQVPEYRDSEDDKREESIGSRIPSNSFNLIMEEAIRTFMNFLKQDRKTHCQILAAFFRRNRKGSSDATLLQLLIKVNKKKRAKINELRRSGNCLRKRKLKNEEELEILMALIDLKVVSRVLRMAYLNSEQIHWCENKMDKVRVSNCKLQRDSSPLFFPAH